MKNLLISLFLIFIITEYKNIYCQKGISKYIPLVGISKQITTGYRFEQKFGDFNEVEDRETIIFYNQNGYKEKVISNDSDIQSLNKIILAEDSSFIQINFKYTTFDSVSEVTHFTADGSITMKIIYIYNHDNQVEEEWTYFSGTPPPSKTYYKYDRRNNLIEVNDYFSDGKLYSKTKYNYDDMGNKVENASYYSNGKLMDIIKYKYNDLGYEVSQLNYGSDGICNFKYEWIYNKSGQNVEEIHYRFSSIDERRKFTYDRNGNLIKQLIFSPNEDSLLYKMDFYYNDDNRLIEETSYKYIMKFGDIVEEPLKKTKHRYISD
mgnify:FL=1